MKGFNEKVFMELCTMSHIVMPNLEFFLYTQ